MTDVDKNIQTLLDIYFERLRKEADNNWTDAYKKAEDFYCRLLNKIYGWQLYNRNYIKNNEWVIDLASVDKNVSVQVSAIKNGKRTKIKGTLKNFKLSKIKQGYKHIYIAFIDEIEIDLNNWADLNDDSINFNVITNILSPKSIIRNISDEADFPTQKRLEINEFLEQEINPKEKGIKSIINIKSISDEFNKDDEFKSNELFFNNKWIILSEKEFALSKKIRCELSNNLYCGNNSYLLIGSSCLGKTTFAYFTSKLLEKYTNIKCFYFKVNSSTKLSDIKNDLLVIKNYFTFVIIDDIQNNIDFTDELYVELKNYPQIKTLYLSRITAKIDSESKGQFYRRKFEIKEIFNPETTFDEVKIVDIINRRLAFYSKTRKDYNFEIGEINKVKSLINFNLLKLSILLHFWSKNGGKLSDINNEKLNKEFYESYDFKDNRDEIELTLRYASVYSLNIPFERQLPFNEHLSQTIFDRLESKGLFHKENSFYVFYHTEFSNLLIEAIISQNPDLQKEGLNQVIQNQFLKYLNSTTVLPSNFDFILETIIENKNIELIEKLFSDNITINKTIEYFNSSKNIPFNFHFIIQNLYNKNKAEFIEQVINKVDLLKLLLLYYTQLDYKTINEFISILLKLKLPESDSIKCLLVNHLNTLFPFNKIRTFEESGYKLKNKLFDYCEFAGIDTHNFNFKINNTEIVSFVSSTPINELTLQILKDSNNLEITNERLRVLDFSQWIEKFYYTPFLLLGNCLSELYKTPLASKLSIDIYSNLNADFLFSKALEYKKHPVKVSKSINELAIFKFLDGNEKIISLSNNLIKNLEFKKSIENQFIDDFARILSDFSFNISASNTLINLYTTEQYVEKLSDENINLYTVTQIINNLKTVSPSIASEILINLTKTDFIHEKMIADSLNGINELKKILNSFKIKLAPSKKSLSNEKLLEVFTSETDLTKIAKSIENLKSNKTLVSHVFQLPQLSVANFYENAKKNEFRITHLQQIFPKLKEADLDLCYKLYISLSDNFFIAPANRTYFQGICHTLSNLQTIDFDYSQKYNLNSAKTKSILDNLFTNRKSRLLSRAKKSPIDEFLIGYVQLWNIDGKLVKKHFDPILSEKITKDESQDDVNINVNISSFGQGIRSYIELDKKNNLKIGESLFNLYFKILKSTINNIDIRKISYGLERISILEFQTDLFAFETTDIIIEKCRKAKTNLDYETGVIPELEKALKGTKGQVLLNRIKEL